MQTPSEIVESCFRNLDTTKSILDRITPIFEEKLIKDRMGNTYTDKLMPIFQKCIGQFKNATA